MEDFTFPPKPECLEDFRKVAPKLRFDPAAYAHYLAEYDLTEEQQLTLMRVVWDFLMMVADAGFELDSVSLVSSESAEPDHEPSEQKGHDNKEDPSP